MPIFNIQKDKLTQVKEKSISLEKELQKITEKNLEEVFGYDFVVSEFQLQNLRIDTLAYDKDKKSFIIIEYKRDRNISVIDQGISYLALMLNSKADFILEYNEKTDKNLKKNDVDWSQSKVLFLSTSFTKFQKHAINFKDLPIELWEIRKFDNDTILYNQIKPLETMESITTIAKGETIKTVSDEVKQYSVEDLFKEDWTLQRKIYDEIREKILEIDNRFDEVPTQQYIGYKIDRTVVVNIRPQKTRLKVNLGRIKPEDVRDIESKLAYERNSFKNYGIHVSYFFIDNINDIDYGMYLIKQVYEKFYN